MAHRGGFFAYGGPDSLPDAPSKRLIAALLSDLLIVMDNVIEKGAPGYQAAHENYKADSQKINGRIQVPGRTPPDGRMG